MEWLAWIIGLIAVLGMAVALGYVFVQQGLSAQDRRGPGTKDVKRERLSPSRRRALWRG